MIAKIRDFLNKKGWDALIITRTDSFLGEHYPPESKQLQRACGFRGSAGMAVIARDTAALFVDSRYTLQAQRQSALPVFEIPTQTLPSTWMTQHLAGKKIAYNPWQRSVSWVMEMEPLLAGAGIALLPPADDDWLQLFPPQPFHQEAFVFDYDLRYAGEQPARKTAAAAERLRAAGLDAFVISSPDSWSWLHNKRSRLVPAYPVVFERGIIYADSRTAPWSAALLPSLKGLKVGLDFNSAPHALCQQLMTAATLVNARDPLAELKAIKNTAEISNIRQACLSESAVLCRFLAELARRLNEWTERDCDAALQALRRENPLYFADSFESVIAIGDHAALAHYRADADSDRALTAAPLALVDTGAHYMNGTTDTTRTLCLGAPSALMKRRYTQVLKGHIALAAAIIRRGSSPRALDEEAHRFLRADSADYFHATGHGIGMMLDVHEAPPVIHEKSTYGMQAGMVFSNEPAYYDAAEGFGIRLENVMLSQECDAESLCFEALTLVPFDGKLTDMTLLTPAEKSWLQAYHARIQRQVLPLLPADAATFIQTLLDFWL